MIYKIEKTNAGIYHEYDIYENGEIVYYGRLGTFSKYQKIKLEGKNETAKTSFCFSGILNFIPFSHWFGKSKQKKRFDCRIKGKSIGSFYRSIEGYMKQRSVICLPNGDKLYAYNYSHGKFSHVSIYADDDETQIAHIKTSLTARNGCYTHILYLLDEMRDLERLLLSFVLYHDNFEYTERGNLYFGKTSGVAYSFDKYKHKYNSSWIDVNFGDGSYFL